MYPIDVLWRVGVAYYDACIRHLYVLEVWEDGHGDFALIDLGTLFTIILMYFCVLTQMFARIKIVFKLLFSFLSSLMQFCWVSSEISSEA